MVLCVTALFTLGDHSSTRLFAGVVAMQCDLHHIMLRFVLTFPGILPIFIVKLAVCPGRGVRNQLNRSAGVLGTKTVYLW
ncbi:hypothetical protein D2E25_0204 [Bifidobacterium goeldii]|uniref:Uncharacterized protein n=1 Tax=Bifidobacterium goeldii TaxID=2306975 RepID=A0A430FMC4_9BIFI|nr:hypothetical protein D2E25_0204 [Bifidobacterium goeldii]